MKCLWPSRVERGIGVLVVDYRSSGVDIDEANQAVRRIRDIAQKNLTPMFCRTLVPLEVCFNRT